LPVRIIYPIPNKDSSGLGLNACFTVLIYQQKAPSFLEHHHTQAIFTKHGLGKPCILSPPVLLRNGILHCTQHPLSPGLKRAKSPRFPLSHARLGFPNKAIQIYWLQFTISLERPRRLVSFCRRGSDLIVFTSHPAFSFKFASPFLNPRRYCALQYPTEFINVLINLTLLQP